MRPGFSISDRLRNIVNKRRKSWRQVERIFDKIYHRNDWGSNQSVSGTGSEDIQTNELVLRLPGILQELRVTSILDIPCGDFHWMRRIDLRGINYTGADIVRPVIAENKRKYTNDARAFCQLNLITDTLPRVDFILCRDCLVHFSLADVTTALRNVARSASTYFAATTFPGRGTNREIKTGGWRPLDLQAGPFFLPEPLALINERCTEAGGVYVDKSLAIWRVADLPQIRRERTFSEEQ